MTSRNIELVQSLLIPEVTYSVEVQIATLRLILYKQSMLNWSERQAVYSGMLKYMHSLGSMSDSKLMQSILDALTETELEAWQNLVESAKEPSSKRASKKSTTRSAKVSKLLGPYLVDTAESEKDLEELWKKVFPEIGKDEYK